MPCCTGKNKGDTVKETLNKARLTALHAICVLPDETFEKFWEKYI